MIIAWDTLINSSITHSSSILMNHLKQEVRTRVVHQVSPTIVDRCQRMVENSAWSRAISPGLTLDQARTNRGNTNQRDRRVKRVKYEFRSIWMRQGQQGRRTLLRIKQQITINLLNNVNNNNINQPNRKEAIPTAEESSPKAKWLLRMLLSSISYKYNSNSLTKRDTSNNYKKYKCNSRNNNKLNIRNKPK